MANHAEKCGKRFGILFGIIMVLSVCAGCEFGPFIYQYIGQWCIYTVVAGWWSTLCLVGATAFDVIVALVSLAGTAATKMCSIKSRLAKGFAVGGMAVLCLIAAWMHFARGVAIRQSVENSTQYQVGDTKDGCELKSDIYVTIVMENGGTPQDLGVRYEVTGVEQVELPTMVVVLDFPRHFACDTFGSGPIKVTVRPLYRDVTVRFADPLVSLGKETVVQKHDPDLLGSAPGEDQDDYSPFFEYRFGRIGEVHRCPIRGVENTLEMQDKTVLLRWDNEWELSCRDVLNHQEMFADEGDTVDIYYPGERAVFDLDMIWNSESPDQTLLQKLRDAQRYELSLESVNSGAVPRGEVEVGTVFAGSLAERPKCIVKTGPDIVYHCWAGANELGCYCLEILGGTVQWQLAPEEAPAVVLRLEIG